ncbi:cytochrome d ubiquinol oxidase subunit II [Desertimonas flava]|jgi:cytochrome d ubiquinol oxidase subunit II|uniref:cytochrome d ubiquinol oxidase subunit II n=1 Tax=Desertimonas flava TaxID=2064846 RepID=UPI000E34EC48|nr:cytochrome d ubiquinol oxidase subunit II [Desertimonas flava]
MSLVDVVAAMLFLGVLCYALFGGADFGSGIWDLLALDRREAPALRHQIDRSIGPVWEANHVWLIYVLVFLWTGFPEGFGAIVTTLYVPWLFVGLGIVLRGAGFAFRKFAGSWERARLYGVVFATSSLITPFFLGMIAGGIASGRVPADGSGSLVTSWTGPTSWVGGVLAVLTCTFLAGSFLAADAQRAGDDHLAAWVGRRNLVVGAITGFVAVAAIVPIRIDSDTLADRLQGRGAAALIVSAAAGATSLWLLRAGRWAVARISTVVAVAAIVIGWGVAQYPDLLADTLTLEDAAGARATQVGLVVTFAAAAVTAVPAMLWLFVLVNRRDWAVDPPVEGPIPEPRSTES